MNIKSIHILYADDDVDDCNFFREAALALPMNTEVTIVKDGEELLNYLAENEATLPHVLFLDINMPRKNGFECLVEIKQNPKTEGSSYSHVLNFKIE